MRCLTHADNIRRPNYIAWGKYLKIQYNYKTNIILKNLNKYLANIKKKSVSSFPDVGEDELWFTPSCIAPLDELGCKCITKMSQVILMLLCTMFILIEAQRASAGISPSETVLISRENNYCDRNITYPLHITSFHCCMTYWSKSVQNATYLIVEQSSFNDFVKGT